MKKLISLLLSAVIAFGLIAIAPITAGAEESEEEKSGETLLAQYLIENSDNWYIYAKNKTVANYIEESGLDIEKVHSEIERILNQQWDDGLLSYSGYDTKFERAVSAISFDCDRFTLYYDANDYGIYYYDTKGIESYGSQGQITDNYFIFCNGSRPTPFFGLYFIGYDDNMYEIPKACEMGIVDEEELMTQLEGAPLIEILVRGDVNSDDLLDINDATYIQMYIAGLTDFDYWLAEYNADFIFDGIVDINDVTAIQMRLAGYKTY